MANNNYLNKVSFIFILLLLCSAGCNNSTDPQLEPDLKLELEDVSCTEAWITLTANNLQLPATLNLLKDNTITKTINLQTADTLLYIGSLLPNQTYNFQAIIQSSNQSIKSNEIAAATLDTTSHNFTWQTWTFGEHSSSTLYDVAIVNENCIWAVGEIYVADTSANGYTMYNAVHWDGNEWNLKKITVNFRGFLITPALEGIFAFSPSQIWLSGGLTIFGDGTNWTPYDIRLITGIDLLSASKIWGSRPDNMYFVGRNGNITHYNGSQWRKIESGTSLNIGDIWGIENNDGGYNKYLAADDAMLIIDNENNLHRINAEQGHSLLNVWGNNDRLLYIAGGTGLVLYKNYRWEKINRPDLNSVYGIKGSEYNDVFGLSATRLIIHFNGVDWQFLNTPKNNSNVRLNVKDNITASVGWQEEKAAITILSRNN